MPLILNIDTATETAGICLCEDGIELLSAQNTNQKDHAAWLHVAIDTIMQQAAFKMKDLNAIAVTSGPGSYTGLRVGMSAAKGFCYALNIPMITENTLKVMAFAALEQSENKDILFCPMIDARRMEVFTAVFNNKFEELLPTTAIVLDENSFSDLLGSNKLLFFGSGREKWRKICYSPNAQFIDVGFRPVYLGILANKKYILKQFTDILYSEP